MSHQGWHFLEASKRLRYGDGREVKVGDVYISAAEPVLCESGMHWSSRLIDAIQYAPGPILCRVESVDGYPVIEGDDKCVSKARKVIAMADATDLMWELSRVFAARVFWTHFKREDYPDVAAWLDHGDFARKTAAEYAVEYAAWSAAGSAAWSAARSAAESAMNEIAEAKALALLGIKRGEA